MKSTTSKPAVAQPKRNAPFFSKDNDHGFFGQSRNKSSFFSPANAGSCIQPKLTVGKPNDKYEKEADTVADKVVQRMAISENASMGENRVKPLAGAISPLVNRKCEDCEQEEKVQKKEDTKELQMQRGDTQIHSPQGSCSCPACTAARAKTIQTKPIFESEEQHELQKKGESSPTPSNLQSDISATKGNGSALPSAARANMESAMGADFSNVKIHTDNKANELSRGLKAQAFTHGNHIYFNSGKYDPQNQKGQHLLAHELTHTIQQGASTSKGGTISKKEGTIQRYPQAGEVLPATEKQNKYYSHRNDIVDIKGKSTFSPETGLANYIASLWENHQDAPVNIKFGSLAQGFIWIKPRGSYVNKRCLDVPLTLFGPTLSICKDVAPEPANYYAESQVIPMNHPSFKNTEKGSVVLVVSIINGFITGKMGWIEGKKPDDIEPLMDAGLAVTTESAFLPLIFGDEYDGTNYSSVHFNNDILSGGLFFGTIGILKLANQQEVNGIFALNDSLEFFRAQLIGKPKGLEEYKAPVKRTPEAELSAESLNLELDANWTAGAADDEQGKFVATGQLRVSYRNGVLEFFGKATYSSSRINGEVNISIATESMSKTLFEQHSPGNKVKGAVGLNPGTAVDDPQEPLALTAWGNLSFKLIDTENATAAGAPKGKTNILDNLEGEAAFVASSDGYIILAGKVRFPTKWKLTKPLDYRSDDAEDKDKHLFQHSLTVAEAPVPFGTVALKLGITLDADAHLDPLELYEIEIGGVYSNHPDYRSEVDITPRFYIQGNAGATVVVTAEGGYRLGGLFTLGEIDGELKGVARASAFIDAAPTVSKIWEGGDKPAKYAISGIIHTGGQITFALSGSIKVRVLKAKIWKSEDYQIGSWKLGEFGVVLEMGEYVLGSGEAPKFDYSKMGLSRKQRQHLGTSISKEREGKGEEDKRKGGFKQEEEGKMKEKGTFSTTAIARPDHDNDPLKNDIEEDFVMLDRLHELILTFGGTRKSPTVILEMSSPVKKPLEQKITEERALVTAGKIFADNVEKEQIDQQLRDLSAIEQEAAAVVSDAKTTAQPTKAEEEPFVAGFDVLDDRISAYGKKYETEDLGVGSSSSANRPGPVTPKSLRVPQSNGASSTMEQRLADARAAVGYSTFEDFKGTNVAIFEYYVLKPGANKIDSTADGPFYESARNQKNALHSEQIIAGELQRIQQSPQFRKKYGPDYPVAVTQILTERSPCGMCSGFLKNNKSTLIIVNNYHTYWLEPYTGSWIERNRNLMIRYGLEPPTLKELHQKYGGRNQDPH